MGQIQLSSSVPVFEVHGVFSNSDLTSTSGNNQEQQQRPLLFWSLLDSPDNSKGGFSCLIVELLLDGVRLSGWMMSLNTIMYLQHLCVLNVIYVKQTHRTPTGLFKDPYLSLVLSPSVLTCLSLSQSKVPIFPISPFTSSLSCSYSL